MRLIDTFFNARVFVETLPLLWRGLLVTIELGLASIVLGLVLGLFLALVRLYGAGLPSFWPASISTSSGRSRCSSC